MRTRRWWCVGWTLGLVWAIAAAAKERLDLEHTQLLLPGAPAAILPVELDGDGVSDLAVVVVYSRWEEVGYEERKRFDGVEGLVEVLTVVPALADRRELHLFRGVPGGYERMGETKTLPLSVLAVEAGGPGQPLVALTDEGFAAIRWKDATDAGEVVPGAESQTEDGEEEVILEPLVEGVPALAGSGALLPGLDLVHDLDRDEAPDFLLPERLGLSVAMAGESAGGHRVVLPGDERSAEGGLSRHYPLPEVRDVDGDGQVDLVFTHPKTGWSGASVARGLGEGRFAAAREVAPGIEEDDPQVVHVGDIDGDGRAELVTLDQIGDDGDLGFREEMKQAKNPSFAAAVYELDGDLAREAAPASSFEVEGYAFGSDELPLPGGFMDVDGDGLSDLVTLTLDFSLFQMVKVVAARRLSIGLDFHIWCQEEGGRFRRVPNLDLSGKFKINLNNVRLGQLSLLRGDFDGDGRRDFVQMGRGRKVSIHRGREGCSYGANPDLVLELEEEPGDLSLVQVRDLDGDGLSDLAVTQPAGAGGLGDAQRVRLDLYLSGVAR